MKKHGHAKITHHTPSHPSRLVPATTPDIPSNAQKYIVRENGLRNQNPIFRVRGRGGRMPRGIWRRDNLSKYGRDCRQNPGPIDSNCTLRRSRRSLCRVFLSCIVWIILEDLGVGVVNCMLSAWCLVLQAARKETSESEGRRKQEEGSPLSSRHSSSCVKTGVFHLTPSYSEHIWSNVVVLFSPQ